VACRPRITPPKWFGKNFTALSLFTSKLIDNARKISPSQTTMQHHKSQDSWRGRYSRSVLCFLASKRIWNWRHLYQKTPFRYKYWPLYGYESYCVFSSNKCTNNPKPYNTSSNHSQEWSFYLHRTQTNSNRIFPTSSSPCPSPGNRVCNSFQIYHLYVIFQYKHMLWRVF
jgi:hypothetical protein